MSILDDVGWCWGHPFLENHLVDFWDLCFLWMNLHVLSFFMNPAWKKQGPISLNASTTALSQEIISVMASQALAFRRCLGGFHGQFSFSWNIPEMSIFSLGISWTCYFHWDIPVFWEIPRILCLFMDFSARIICWFSSHGCSASRFSISAHSPILNGNAIIQQSSNYLSWRCSSSRIILQWWCCLMFQLKLIWLCFIFKFTSLAKFELFEQQRVQSLDLRSTGLHLRNEEWDGSGSSSFLSLGWLIAFTIGFQQPCLITHIKFHSPSIIWDLEMNKSNTHLVLLRVYLEKGLISWILHQ